MTVISTKEFKTNMDKYLELAFNERIFIKEGNNMFIFTNVAGEDDDDYSDYLEARAYENDEKISADDFLRKIYSNAKI